jgi:cation transport protein ChaC
MAHGELWVFAYGSLMWRPNFPYADSQPALIYGYHRALCIHSTHYRGTPDCTGLVVGLDRGGSCPGRAYKIAPADAEATLAYLWKRELNTDSYIAKRLPVYLPNCRVTAWAFVANHANRTQYAGKLAPDEAARRVARGHGKEGSALEYLANTLEHLAKMGIKEGSLHAILEMAREKAERKG